MKGIIIVADAARVHSDNTFSMLRGGIDRVYAPRTKPIHFRGSFLTRISGALSEAGPHDFQLRLMNEDGQSIAPDINGQFTVPEGGGSAIAAGDFGLVLPAYGRYTFALRVDRQELATWEVHAVETPAAK